MKYLMGTVAIALAICGCGSSASHGPDAVALAKKLGLCQDPVRQGSEAACPQGGQMVTVAPLPQSRRSAAIDDARANAYCAEIGPDWIISAPNAMVLSAALPESMQKFESDHDAIRYGC